MANQRGVALVTGANRGIGLEVCRQLAIEGFDVILTARDATKGEAAAAELQREGLNVTAYTLDVSDAASIETARDRLQDERGVLDVLLNNAGANYDTWQDVLNVDFDTVEETLRINTLGPWRMTLAFLPLLRQSQHPRVVNVSSQAGSLSSQSGGTPAYSLSKLALNGVTKQLASRLKGDGILVNSVCPGWVATDMGNQDGRSGGRPIPDGAASVVWAALLPDDGPTGGFYRDGRELEF
jgi:NAD(P)-dependent dehydrogenase (short-subunit alcohol dehydrogenase family)